jgi:zinc transport system substrate-binding protein
MLRFCLYLSLALAPWSALADVPKVVTDIPIVQSLVAEVMGDLGSPAVLVGGGADAHAYQLRPSEARALAGADLVVWIGPEMTPWLGRVLSAAPDVQVTGLLASKGTTLRNFADADGTTSIDPENHDHAGIDPHAWLDPGNAETWLGVIANELSTADPEHAAIYRQNAEEAVKRTADLAAELDGILARSQDRPIVVGHQAYGYFAQRFGLKVAASIESGDAAEPGAARLSEIAALVKSAGVGCLFPEVGQDPKRAGVLIEGSVAKLGAPLDPEGRTLDPGPGLYPTLMRNLAEAIAACQSQ